jgi:urease accessory protein
MGTQTTTTMSTKRSRRRTRDGTRGPRVARDAALSPLVPVRGTPRRSRRGDPVAGTQFTNADKAVLDSRLRGIERSKRSVTKDAGTAVDLNAAALYRLMAWLSPAYPIGAFSYSSGIEWAVEAGDVADAATLECWLAVMIADGGGFCDGVFFAHAHRAAAERDDKALRAVAELATAFAPSRERHLETTAQGCAFLDATRAAWPTPALDRLLAVWDGAVALPVAVAVASAGHGIALAPALQAYLHALTANLVSAGVRLVPLGQTDGQRVLAALEPVVAATAARALTTPLDEVGGAAFRADLASMRHETQHTRLFRS